jgi:hypothetical protein
VDCCWRIGWAFHPREALLRNELADLSGRGFGLLALDPDQRGLVFAIIEKDVKYAVHQQGDGNHGDEQRDVFREQPAAAGEFAAVASIGALETVIGLGSLTRAKTTNPPS